MDKPLSKPTISIVLATFRGERYLTRQLDSLVAQHSAPDELIVSDDCSPDGTPALIEAFARTAPFIVKFARNEKLLGFRHNFMQAVSRATGDIILLCDQDDIWMPSKVGTVRQAFIDDPDLMLLYHNATIVDADERPVATMFDGIAEQSLLQPGAMPPWHYARGLVQAFRRELCAYEQHWLETREHFSADLLGHDRWFYFLGTSLGKVRFLDEPLLHYRQHDQNAYGADQPRSLRERLDRALTHDVSADVLSEHGARSRAAVLRAIVPTLDVAASGRARTVAAEYEVFADRLRRRQAIYSAETMTGRAAAMVDCLWRGDYRGAPWAFNPASAARDLLGGVIARRTGAE